jgi:hypothetical protein
MSDERGRSSRGNRHTSGKRRWWWRLVTGAWSAFSKDEGHQATRDDYGQEVFAEVKKQLGVTQIDFALPSCRERDHARYLDADEGKNGEDDTDASAHTLTGLYHQICSETFIITSTARAL